MNIEVRAKAGSKRDRITTAENSSGKTFLIVELKAVAEGGKANAALIKLLARHFGVTRAAVTIKRGATSRNKLVEVTSLKHSTL